jgi:hypothetical protein
MDAIVVELLHGPKSPELAERTSWFKRVHAFCAVAPEANVQRMAEPLKRGIELLAQLETADEPAREELEQELIYLTLSLQGLALLGYLEELNRVRNEVAAMASRLEADSDERKRAERLQGAYEQAIHFLSRAYNGLREGKVEELESVGPAMEQVQKIAGELRS